MDKRDKILLRKILDEANIIADLITGHDCDSFIADEKTKRAVCMTLINIGEMVKLVSDDLKRNNTSIPWRSIAGLRDITAHGYMTLRMEYVWETVRMDVPILVTKIQKLLDF
ncbi:MAG: DUF86 domain-containing protein [Defluviitaleaceae bacterium]|nr:DUF86 domain-containing protein [Defluviitaleaceae bacterium]